jgi:hypothetical protein
MVSAACGNFPPALQRFPGMPEALRSENAKRGTCVFTESA